MKIKFLSLYILFFALLTYAVFNMHKTGGFNFVNYFVCLSNDNGELFMPSDNLIEKGFYSYNGVDPYTDRIPGISVFYVPLRFFFSANTCFTLLVLLQITLYLILLKNILKEIEFLGNKKLAFGIGLIVVFLTPYYWLLLTGNEGFSLVFSSFAFIYLKRTLNAPSSKGFFLTGIFFCLAVTFRGYLIPSFIVICLSIPLLFFILKKQLQMNQFVYILLPLVIYLFIWTSRNYLQTGKIIVLQTNNRPQTSIYKESNKQVKFALKKLGFETVDFYKGNPFLFVVGRDSIPPDNFKETFLKENIDYNELLKLRTLIINDNFFPSASNQKKVIEQNEKLKKLIDEKVGFFKRIIFYPAKNFIRSYTYNFTSCWGLPAWDVANIFEKAYRLFLHLLFHALVLCSLLLSFFHFIKRKKQAVYYGIYLVWFFSMAFVYTFLIDNIEFKYYLNLFVLAPLVLAYFFTDTKQYQQIPV